MAHKTGYLDLIRTGNPLGLWPGSEDSAAAFDRIPLRCDGATIGSIDPALSVVLLDFPDVFRPAGAALTVSCPGPVRRRSGAFAEVARWLFEEGYIRGWRDERLAVMAFEGGPKLFEIERSAMRFFGFLTQAAHLNGIAGERMWVARRSLDKPIDPGRLDNLVGGGVPAGLTVLETLVKESWEEAGIGAELVLQAQRTATIGICRLSGEGLRREILHAHDLHLPAGFEPVNQDGEVADFRLETLEHVAALASDGEFTLDAALVLLDYLIRSDQPSVAPTDRDRFASLCRRLN